MLRCSIRIHIFLLWSLYRVDVRAPQPLLQVIKNSKDFFDQSLDEIKLLKLLQQHDPTDSKNVLRLYDFFYIKVPSPPPLPPNPCVKCALPPALLHRVLMTNAGAPVHRH